METFLSFAISLPLPYCQFSVISEAQTSDEINWIIYNNDQHLDLSQDDDNGYILHDTIREKCIYKRRTEKVRCLAEPCLDLFCDALKNE